MAAYLDLSAELQGCATWVLLLLQKKKGNREKRKDVKSGKDTEAHRQLERRDLNMVEKKGQLSTETVDGILNNTLMLGSGRHTCISV